MHAGATTSADAKAGLAGVARFNRSARSAW